MEPTIIVDWTLFRTNPYTQDFVMRRLGNARFVLLVSDPVNDNYEYGDYPELPAVNWDAVIRNSGGLEDVMFKAMAVDVLQNASSLQPVIALDPNPLVDKMYREAGVLITTKELR